MTAPINQPATPPLPVWERRRWRHQWWVPADAVHHYLSVLAGQTAAEIAAKDRRIANLEGELDRLRQAWADMQHRHAPRPGATGYRQPDPPYRAVGVWPGWNLGGDLPRDGDGPPGPLDGRP